MKFRKLKTAAGLAALLRGSLRIEALEEVRLFDEAAHGWTT